MSRSTKTLIEKLSRVLGPPSCTPEFVMAPDYRESRELVRARYRVFRWPCPSCLSGHPDPIYRSFVVDSEGRVWCNATWCAEQDLATTISSLLTA